MHDEIRRTIGALPAQGCESTIAHGLASMDGIKKTVPSGPHSNRLEQKHRDSSLSKRVQAEVTAVQAERKQTMTTALTSEIKKRLRREKLNRGDRVLDQIKDYIHKRLNRRK